MGRPLRQLASDTAVYGFSSILARFINYVLVPFYTHVFTTAEYGAVAKVYAAFVLLNVIYTYGMESAYLKFAANKPLDERRRIFSTALTALTATALTFSLLLVMFRGPAAALMRLAPDQHVLILYMAGVLIADTLLAVPMAHLRLARRSWLFAAIRLLSVGVNLGLNLWLILGLGWGVEAVLASNLAASLIAGALALSSVRRLFVAAFDRSLFAGMLRFGMPFVPTGAAYAVTEAIDRFFLDRMPADRVEALYGEGMAADDVVGVYNACFKLGVFMLLYVQMFRFAWQPFFLQHQDAPEAPRLFSRAFTYFTAVGLGVFLAVSLFARQIVAIPVPVGGETQPLINPAYWDGLFIVPLILLAYLAQGWYTHFTAGVFIRGRTLHLPWITLLGAGVTLLINGMFTAQYGMAAASTAALASHAVMAAAIGVVAQRMYPIPFEWVRLAAMGCVAGAGYGLHAMTPDGAVLMRLAIIIVAGAALMAAAYRRT